MAKSSASIDRSTEAESKPRGEEYLDRAPDEPKRKKGGRPAIVTLISPEQREKLLGLLRMGMYFDPACLCCRINPITAREWLERGRDAGRGSQRNRASLQVYRVFATEVAEAQASAEALLLGRVIGGKSGWEGAWRVMRCKFHRRWRDTETVRIEQDALAAPQPEIRAEAIPASVVEEKRAVLQRAVLALAAAQRLPPPPEAVTEYAPVPAQDEDA